jgi:Ca2+-binding EF-hand superfamily protein
MSLYNSYAAVSTKSLNLLLEKRSIELFNMCDQEGKGFINKKDIQRMHHTEPGCFTPEMLEEVFEALDTDGNGFLTLDEFAFGFATLFQAESAAEDTVDDEETTSNGSANENSMSHFSIEEHEDDEQVEAEFKGTMEQLGAEDLIKER